MSSQSDEGCRAGGVAKLSPGLDSPWGFLQVGPSACDVDTATGVSVASRRRERSHWLGWRMETTGRMSEGDKAAIIGERGVDDAGVVGGEGDHARRA